MKSHGTAIESIMHAKKLYCKFQSFGTWQSLNQVIELQYHKHTIESAIDSIEKNKKRDTKQYQMIAQSHKFTF